MHITLFKKLFLFLCVIDVTIASQDPYYYQGQSTECVELELLLFCQTVLNKCMFLVHVILTFNHMLFSSRKAKDNRRVY